MSTINPSLDQGDLQTFERNFYHLANQTESKLVNSGVATFLPTDSTVHNYGRIGAIELSKLTGRNPDKNYSDISLDNRQLTKERHSVTVTLDNQLDLKEMIADPQSSIIQEMVEASNRQIDRSLAEGSVGNVLVGASDKATTSITAAADGVITIDGTSGFDYTVVQTATQNFINNNVSDDVIKGSLFCLSGKEHTSLMGDEKFINNDYINPSMMPVDKGFINSAGMYQITRFAGSVNGGIQVLNPILPEVSTLRKCIILSQKSMLVSMKVKGIKVADNPNKADSIDITLNLIIGTMRKEGKLIQIVNTTI